MNEVEKMYENAGIKPVIRDNAIGRGYYIEHQRVEEYPPFTPEKQLELIKWLAKKSHITIGLGLPWGQYDDNWWTVTRFGGGAGQDKYRFEEALADLVNDLWQDLTEEERKQIKEILSE